ncbi:hypothetical protein ABPG74_015786 [Tetrahymena malaccensis]
MLTSTLFIYISCIILGLFIALFSSKRKRELQKQNSPSAQNTKETPIQLDKLIIGLGNPGQSYENMRHNVGKLFISYTANKFKAQLKKINQGYLAILNEDTDQPKIGLFNTYCYMNISGKSISEVIKKHQVKVENIIVVHDDLDNAFGKVKIKEGGSAEGHNGLKSIIEYLDTKEFLRLKIGIDRPNSRDPVVISPYVLGNFSSEQLNRLNSEIFEKGIEILKSKNFIQS